MGRMKDRDFQIIKEGLQTNRYGYGNYAEVVRGLVAHAEAIEKELHEVVAKFGQSESNVDCLMENMLQLQRKIEDKKVVLPRSVAEAIEEIRYSKDGITDYGILITFIKSDSHKSARAALFKRANPFSVIMEALVNGYTIEEPPTTEDKIVASLTQALEEMQVESPVPVERLAKVLTHAIREVLAGDRQEEYTN